MGEPLLGRPVPLHLFHTPAFAPFAYSDFGTVPVLHMLAFQPLVFVPVHVRVLCTCDPNRTNLLNPLFVLGIARTWLFFLV